MEIIAGAVITVAGSFVVTWLTNLYNQRKLTAEIDEIYGRLGIDKDKAKADNANTWMDVARKAAEEYERVMNENISLKKQVVTLQGQVRVLRARISLLEGKKKRAR